VIVIGGGITGAGIFLEVASAGLIVLLLEGNDFASGTSSRSSKLVHGGLRYLRNGQLRIMKDCVSERNKLLQEATGLVNPLPFLFLNYATNKTKLWQFGLGLAIYDLLGLQWRHGRLSPSVLTELMPGLRAVDLLGGHHYLDAQTDDARLVLRVIREGVLTGGVALNYVRVEELLLGSGGQVRGVAVQDLGPDGNGRTKEVRATVVVNTTGPSADILRRGVGGERRLRHLQGSHLVLSHARLPLSQAVGFAHPADQRPVFVLPWEGVTLFGTTDIEQSQNNDQEPVIGPEEFEYLMEALTFAFPGLALTEADVQSTFSGVRAVVDSGQADPSKESREHALWEENGLLTVTGGKLTTFRLMAHQAMKRIWPRLPHKPHRGRRQLFDESIDTTHLAGIDPHLGLRLIGRHGLDTLDLLATAGDGEQAPIDKTVAGCPLWAELRWAMRSEGVIHLEDLLLRRVRLSLLLPLGGISLLSQIKPMAQIELGWDQHRWDKEVTAYARLWYSAYTFSKEEFSLDPYCLGIPANERKTGLVEPSGRIKL
jgi:glycerol-3-phosphate dehydrogenase